MFELIRSLFTAKPQQGLPQEEIQSLDEIYCSLKEKHCIELKIPDWIKEGKVSEPVISFCDTVVNDPGRFMIEKQKVTDWNKPPYSIRRDNVFVDKFTGRRFNYGIGLPDLIGHIKKEGYWRSYSCCLTNIPNFESDKILNIELSQYRDLIEIREVSEVFNDFLLTQEEQMYVAHRVIPVVKKYFITRRQKLTALRLERKNRAILKEREALKKVYCK